MTSRARRVFAILATVAVAASVVGGLYMLGSPQTEREHRLDARRIAELRAISNGVDLYWTRRGRLPASLSELSREQGIQMSLVDPATGHPYVYRVLGEAGYELCAKFARSTQAGNDSPRAEFWTHGAGSQCFRLEPKSVKR